VDSDGFRLLTLDGVELVRCAALDRLPGIAHGFSTARSPQSGRFLQACGLGDQSPLLLRQVHGKRLVDRREGGDGIEADGIVASRDDGAAGAPTVKTADCVPILLAAADGSRIAAVHAGWRGIAAGIVPAGVERLAQGEPETLVAAIGPAIGPCCYEVGPEVAAAVPGATVAGAGRPHLDLKRAVVLQLVRAGLAEGRVHRAPWCTRCSDGLFFSYRRQGKAAGRQLATIGWRLP
jgi:YfiH family protein